MSRNRYVGDYHLADSLDERGRIHTDVEYTGSPYTFTGTLTGTAAETFPLRERFEHRYADRLENRFPASSAFVVILSALSLAGEAVNLIRGKALLTGDIVFAACGAAVLTAGAAAHRTGKLLKCGKVE